MLRGIAVAQCRRGDDAPVPVPAFDGRRRWSREAALGWLIDLAARKADILIGIDFSPALPFVDRGAYLPGWPDAPHDAPELWALVDRLCREDRHLGAGSLVDHAEGHRYFRRHGGREGDLFGGGVGRLREVERVCREAGLGAAQSCFNLVGPAQVGKSSLTGMRMLHRLMGRVPVWPFDPVPPHGPLIVEIYTTVAAREARVTGGSKMRDAAALDAALDRLGSAYHAPFPRYDDHMTDAMLTAAWLRRAADRPELWETAGIEPVRRTEGWTFGVPCRMGARAAPD